MATRMKFWRVVLAAGYLASLMIGGWQPSAGLAAETQREAGSASAAEAQARSLQPTVSFSIKNDTLASLASVESRAPLAAKTVAPRTIDTQPLPYRAPREVKGAESAFTDPALQSSPGGVLMPEAQINFEGLSNADNEAVIGGMVAPPDTAGAVGHDPATGKKYYVQMVNLVFAVWDVTNQPTMVYGPAAGNAPWAGFGGICETNNDGDVIVLYDATANRWLLSQFALFGSDGHHQCVAISQTGDPTGSWHRYDFLASATKINDYPKFGIWPDGYYMSANQFNGFTFDWGGQGAWVFERDKMLLGEPARQIYFDLYDTDPNLAGMLPSDFDGTPPPAGAPNIFMNFDDDAWGYTEQDQLQVWEFHTDWNNPGASTLTHSGNLATEPFESQLCQASRGQCVEQPNGQTLESLSDRLMYRLQYRNMGSHQAMVVNHSVNADGSGKAGIRWYELRNSGSAWDIYQQGTYSPDSDSRWMGSIAMDAAGNIAVGYSVSSTNTNPSIRYAGRLAGDPLNTLAQREVELIAGTYSQEGIGRWGDYSMMTLDPEDDCTFWFTTEYVREPNAAGWGNWNTRIGAFKYQSCTAGPSGTLNGTVTSATDGAPVVSARVQVGDQTETFTDENGFYQVFNLPVGVYDVTVSSYGFIAETAEDVAISDGAVTTQNFVLAEAPKVTLTGKVYDEVQGWPLYARIHISTFGHEETIFTNPFTGQYSVVLLQDTEYTFTVSAIVEGYANTVRTVTPPAGGAVEDFALQIESSMCRAPGYSPEYVYFSDFEANDGGFTVQGENSSWEWGEPNSGPGKAVSGEKVWGTNLSGDYNDGENSYIVSPPIDLSAYKNDTIIVSWYQWLKTEADFDYAFVDVSYDGGQSWLTYVGPASGDYNLEWAPYTLYLDSQFAVSNFLIRFQLISDEFVTAPGFYVDDVSVAIAQKPETFYSEDFESGDGGFTVSGSNPSWEHGTPTRGPNGAHSGENAWGTNLDGSYNNNEDSYLTSPVIDLSGASGKFLTLTLWQWLQTESGYDFASIEVSSDGGETWSVIFGPFSGIIDTDWGKYFIGLDPALMTSEFQLRFRLNSDDQLTYPGYYIDDINIAVQTEGPPVLPCNPESGGLVVGYVTDENTGEPLIGARVQDELGHHATSMATPEDPMVEEGLYILFSETGNQSLSATKSNGYGTDTEIATVILGDTVRQDFALPAGLLSPSPDTLATTMAMNEQKDLSLTLNNLGGLEATYEIKERGGGIIPAPSKGAPVTIKTGSFSPYAAGSGAKASEEILKPIPIHAPPWTDVQSYPTRIMDNTAAVWDGLVYSVGGFDGNQNVSTAYVYDPDTDSWAQLTNMSREREKPAAAFIDGKLYVVGGWDNFGNTVQEMEVYDPDTDSWSFAAPVPSAKAGAAGVSLGGMFYVIGGCDPQFCFSTEAYRYDPALDTWESIPNYPEPVSWQACVPIDGKIYCAGGVSDAGELDRTYVYDPEEESWTKLATMPQTQWAMGYTASSGRLYISGGVTANFSTITNQTWVYDPVNDAWSGDANSNHTVYRGGSACGFYKIGGDQGGFNPLDGVEMYPGLLDCDDETDVPWLSVTPESGTIPAGGSETLTVHLDSSVPEINQPGEYTALVNIKTDTPYKVEPVVVKMNITPPPTWGKVTGVVSGLTRCDAQAAPLAGVDVLLNGVVVTQTDENGRYTYWTVQGSYTLTFEAEGYVTQTVTAAIAPGQVKTINQSLRLDAPCVTASTNALVFELPQAGEASKVVTLENQGAGELVFRVEESPLVLKTTATALADGHEVHFRRAASQGPASVLSLAGSSNSEELGPLASESGWFGGEELPLGVLRYASAQCYEYPNQFFVFSGVDRTFSVVNNAWRYDSTSNSWQALAPIPFGQEGATATCYQGKIYVMGGGGTNQFYIYDIASDSWSAGAPLPRMVAGAMAGAWDGKIFLIGGDDDFVPMTGVSNEVNIYNIASDSWSGLGNPMPVGATFAGFAQQGKYLYIIGGWGAEAPITNLVRSNRYDLSANQWLRGPDFLSARADFALAVTDGSLYAIAGDENGDGFFDATSLVERLAVDKWPAGEWKTYEDPLPVTISSNNGGFCAETFNSAAIWTVGGGDPNTFTIYGDTLFHQVSETCYTIYQDVPWLTVEVDESPMAADSSRQMLVSIDATGLTAGVYHATVAVISSDSGQPVLTIPVTLKVGPLFEVQLLQLMYNQSYP